MGYKFNPFTTRLDFYDSPDSTSTDIAKEIAFDATLGEDISALKVVYIDTDQKAYVATNNDTYKKALALGMAKTAGVAGQIKSFISFGRFDDLFFNFPVGTDLYLGTNGTITDVVPSSGHLTFVGQSLGSGSIFFNVKKTIIL